MNIELKNGSKWPLNTAYNGDCLEFMKNLPDKCIDLVLTDPPYGIGGDKQRVFDDGKRWDSKTPSSDVFKEIFRVSKNQIIWGANYFDCMTGGRIIWNKLGPNIGRRKQAETVSDCEIAYKSHSKNVKMFSYTFIGNVQGNNYNIVDTSYKIHPTQKPLPLFKWCLEKYSKPGDLIFDPFLGSFTTAVACHSHGLNWIGCEKDLDYFKAGTERYDTECLQGLLGF